MRKPRARKLLVASSGVMTVSYLLPACDDRTMGTTVANLMAATYPTATSTPGPGTAPPGSTPTTQPLFTSCVANLPAPPVFTAVPTASVEPIPSATGGAATLPDAGTSPDAGVGGASGVASDAGPGSQEAGVFDAGSDAATGGSR